MTYTYTAQLILGIHVCKKEIKSNNLRITERNILSKNSLTSIENQINTPGLVVCPVSYYYVMYTRDSF